MLGVFFAVFGVLGIFGILFIFAVFPFFPVFPVFPFFQFSSFSHNIYVMGLLFFVPANATVCKHSLQTYYSSCCLFGACSLTKKLALAVVLTPALTSFVTPHTCCEANRLKLLALAFALALVLTFGLPCSFFYPCPFSPKRSPLSRSSLILQVHMHALPRA